MIKYLKIKIKNYDKGLTLIELLIYMGIFSILILAMVGLLATIFDVQLEAQSTSDVSKDGRYIVNKLTYDINNATSASVPAVGVQGQTLVMSDGIITYTYNLQGGNLTLTNSILGTTDQLNSVNTTVSNLSFLKLSDTKSKNVNTITATFTLRSKVLQRGQAESQNFKVTAGTR